MDGAEAPRAAGGSSRARRGEAAGGRAGAGRRATLGSTSYDDAEDVFEPDWGGASWYGPASGTYWTVNPKEYADPRKHGPEYQARARRRAPGPRGPARDRASERRSPPEGLSNARRTAWTGIPQPGREVPPFDREPARAPSAAPDPGVAGPWPPGAGTRSGPDADASPAPGSPGVAPRIVLALAGWLPIGLALAAAVGLPGGLVATMPLQVVGVALLAFRPRAAWAAAGGGVAVVFGTIPIVAVVTALGGGMVPGGPAPPPAVVLAFLAWLGGALAAASGRVAAFPWREGR
jgi:hypothetical protein